MAFLYHRHLLGVELVPELLFKNGRFEPFMYKKRSFYQDRLGTNIGKALKKKSGATLYILTR
jgi:hypothetical protein